MFKKAITILCMASSFCFISAAPAHALNIYWKPANDEQALYTQRAYTTTNKVDIQVRVSDAKNVEINGEEAIRIGGGDSELWILRDYLLKPGENTISAEAEKYKSGKKEDDKTTEKDEIKITVIDEPVSGSFRYFEVFSPTLSAFNKSVVLKLPKDTAVTDNGKAAWDQSIRIEATDMNANLSPYYIPLSPVYTIKAASLSYSLANQGELILKYDSKAANSNSDLITVLYALPNFEPASLRPNMLQRLNSYNLNEGSITVPFYKAGFGHYIVARAIKDFKDFYLKEEGKIDLEWAMPYVTQLWARGIMNPLATYPDGSPVPQEFFGLTDKSGTTELPITKKEFTGLLVKGFRLPVAPLLPHMHTYSDLAGIDLLEAQYIEAAARAGWIPNTPENNGRLFFHPNSRITREQACAIMARAGGFPLATPEQASRVLKAYFPSDYASVHSWNSPHMLACIQNGLLPVNRKGYLEPDKTITRAEAARMVYNLLSMKKVL
jgi:hypothetical protein